ncbi:MAG: SOS response-associated peptidase [Nitriliruptoraceae bacterium]
MCGRYVSVTDPATLADHFSVDEVTTSGHRERFNVAPSTDVYAVIEDGTSRRLGTMRWGFVPVWAKQVGGRGQPINARLETVATSRMFAPSFRRKRCLLPADGFYEWKDRGEGRRKQPYFIAEVSGEPLAFAGIYSSWRADDDQPPIVSAAVVTTSAAGAMRDIHDRMPLMLPASLWASWLTEDADEAPHLLETVQALGPPPLVATPVTARVNAVRNDNPSLLTPGSVDD